MSDTTRSYRPGSWFGIFGDHATVLLPPSEKARVPELWQLVDEGAGFDEVLDALIATGLRELPGFVLISELDADTKVVVRGPACARFTASGETVELAGSAATTWVERSLTAVTAMEIDVDDASDGPGLTIATGLVRVSRVVQPPEAAEAQQPDLGPATEPVSAPVSGHDHDGSTRGSGWPPGPFAPPPGIPGQPPAPAVSRPVARLVLSSGETVDVDRAVVIGRAPEAPSPSSAGEPRLVPVPSPHQEISSTHLEVRPGSGADHGSAVATDLGSTNGTVVVQPGLPPEDLPAGIAVQLAPGAVLDLGDGLTIQVLHP